MTKKILGLRVKSRYMKTITHLRNIIKQNSLQSLCDGRLKEVHEAELVKNFVTFYEIQI